MSLTISPIVFDFVIIGSGFGGSVSALRLIEKGYSVLVIERGKRFRDIDYAKSNWNLPKYLWLPVLRCFGLLQISPFKDVLVLHGSGVGGGSLGYANVLMKPSDKLFDHPLWKHLADWKKVLEPHYETAKFMLGVTTNPCLWPADHTIKEIATELGVENTFQPTTIGVFFGNPGEQDKEVPDPYFSGEGPTRKGCTNCGSCMVGCRQNAKNTLVKNYLYLAEKYGAEIWPECEVRDVQRLDDRQSDGANYEIVFRSSTQWLFKPLKKVRARNVIFSAGSLGTQRLLLRCRDITRSLPVLSKRLGQMVRTNSESLLGVTNRQKKINYSEGVAITSFMLADEKTAIEPVRYPAGSSLMRLLAGPLIESGGSIPLRFLKTLGQIIRYPFDFARVQILPGWAERSTILLVMQTEDNWISMKLGRSLLTGFRRGLVSVTDKTNRVPANIPIGHHVVRQFSQKTNGIPQSSIVEAVFNQPMTAHILGGCPMGLSVEEGVVGPDCQIHNYPGLYIVDGSIMPGNPGINPSLSIAALAEYAMSRIPPIQSGSHE